VTNVKHHFIYKIITLLALVIVAMDSQKKMAYVLNVYLKDVKTAKIKIYVMSVLLLYIIWKKINVSLVALMVNLSMKKFVMIVLQNVKPALTEVVAIRALIHLYLILTDAYQNVKMVNL
jgi:hypothetical protein